jgi:hypothetical protein
MSLGEYDNNGLLDWLMIEDNGCNKKSVIFSKDNETLG